MRALGFVATAAAGVVGFWALLAGLRVGGEQGMVSPERIGVIVGSAFGGMQTFEEQTLKLGGADDRKPRKVSPFAIPALLGNTHAGVIGIELGCKGPNYGLVSACATGSHALGEALSALQRGDADAMLAGGVEAALTPLSFGGFCAMKAMNTDSNDAPTKGSRPFDASRAVRARRRRRRRRRDAPRTTLTPLSPSSLPSSRASSRARAAACSCSRRSRRRSRAARTCTSNSPLPQILRI